MALTPQDGVLIVLALILSASSLFYGRRKSDEPSEHLCPQAYILRNQVTHARHLPLEASHAFTYPTLSLLVSLDALERGSLDLGRGWIFGYGGLWGRLVGLRSEPYVTGQKALSIRNKLEGILGHRGYVDTMDDAWMMTMPSFLGFEGINPLTVYFCYKNGDLWITVLEIHNTFGESHIHVLEVNHNEDETPSRGYDHQWTFPREFHVSPFNDRTGFYKVSVKKPSHLPTLERVNFSASPPSPRPTVRVYLYTASTSIPHSPERLKLTALLRPTSAVPLTSSALLLTLATAPLILFLTMPRILLMAWKLHYQKRLDVYPRPEPLPAAEDWISALPDDTKNLVRRGGGVKWLNEGLLEKYAQRCVISFLVHRVQETGIGVTLIAANPAIARLSYSPLSQAEKEHLTISYLSSQVFIVLLLSPSAQHALLLGSDTEKLFSASSRDLFIKLFSASQVSSSLGILQRLRLRGIGQTIPYPIPACHPLDAESSVVIRGSMIVLSLLLDSLEAFLFRLARVRVVAGQEPWLRWKRAASVYTCIAKGSEVTQL